MPLPNVALSLHGHSRPGDTVHSKPKQAMIVRMSAETLELLDASPNQLPMFFEFGNSPRIYIGDKFFPMESQPENSPHELYLRASSAAKPMAPLKLSANVIGKFTVGRELDQKVEDKVRGSTLLAQKKRTERTAIMLDTPPPTTAPSANRNKKRNQQSALRKPVQPSATVSPSVPIPTGKELPVRSRLIHCLALTPRVADDAIKLVGGPACDASLRKTLLDLLEEVAELTPSSSKKIVEKSARPWELKSRSWLEVRPYEWPKLSESERTSMARSARMAYNHLKIPESDPAWNHVRYRNVANSTPTSTSTAGSSNEPPQAASADPPKRGVMSTEVKEKTAKPKGSKNEVRMKDESSKATPKVINGDGAKSKKPLDGQGAASTSNPVRRLPGSGFKSSKPSPPQAVGVNQPKDKDKDSVTPSPIPSASSQDRKSALGPGGVGRMKKIKDASAGVDSDSERSRNVENGKNKEKEREKVKERERDGDRPRDAADSVKRKKPLREPEEDIDTKSGTSAPKKRKIDDDARPLSLPATRDPEPRLRDLSLPKKPVGLPPPIKNKRALSPSRPLRQTSPHHVKPKREPSPSPRTSMVPPTTHARPSSGSSSHQKSSSDQHHVVERSRKVSKTHRRSPIYTSSEDEGKRAPKAQAPPQPPQPQRARPRPRPPIPLPTDHAALRAHYSSSYTEYLSSFQKVVSEKRKIEGLLRNRMSSITDSDWDGDGVGDEDVELMDAEELARLSAEHRVLREELEKIQQMFANEV